MNRRTGNGRYTVEMKEIPTEGLTTAKEDVEELARRYTKALEEYVYRYPEEWVLAPQSLEAQRGG